MTCLHLRVTHQCSVSPDLCIRCRIPIVLVFQHAQGMKLNKNLQLIGSRSHVCCPDLPTHATDVSQMKHRTWKNGVASTRSVTALAKETISLIWINQITLVLTDGCV